MTAPAFNQDQFFTIESSNGTQTTYDSTIRPSDGDLVLYEIQSGTRRASIVEHRFGTLVFEVSGVFSPIGWVKVLGVAVDIQRAGKT